MKRIKNIQKMVEEYVEGLSLNPFRVSIINIYTYIKESRQFLEKVRKIRLKETDIVKSQHEYIEYLESYIEGINRILNELEKNLKQYYMEPEDIYDLLNTKERFNNEMCEVIEYERTLTSELYDKLTAMVKRQIVPSYYSELLELYNYMITLFVNIKVQIDNTNTLDYKDLKFYQ